MKEICNAIHLVSEIMSAMAVKILFPNLSKEEKKGYLESITDRVFLFIQNNRKAMQEYLCLVSDFDKDQVNQNIGKQVKEWLILENIIKRIPENQKEERCFSPLSVMIKSYAKHVE